VTCLDCIIYFKNMLFEEWYVILCAGERPLVVMIITFGNLFKIIIALFQINKKFPFKFFESINI